MPLRETMEVKKPEGVKPGEETLDLLQDRVRNGEKYKNVDPLQKEIVDAIVNAVVDKAKRDISTEGRSNEAVQKDQGRIQKAGEVWRGKLLKVASEEQEADKPFGGDQREIWRLSRQRHKNTLHATLNYYQSYRERMSRPMTDKTRQAKSNAVVRLAHAYRELEKEARPLIERYHQVKSTAAYLFRIRIETKPYIEEKIRGLRALQTELDAPPSESDNGLVALLGWHVLRSHDFVGAPAEQRDHVSMRDTIKAALEKNIRFWEEVHKLHEMELGEYRKITENIKDYLGSILSKQYKHIIDIRQIFLKGIDIEDNIIDYAKMDKEEALQAIGAKVRQSFLSDMSDQDQKRLLERAEVARRMIRATDFVDFSYHSEMNNVELMSMIQYNHSIASVQKSLKKMGVEGDIIENVETDKEEALQAIEAKVRESSLSDMSDQDKKRLLEIATKSRSVIEANFVDPDHPYSVYHRQNSELEELRYTYYNITAKIDRRTREVKNLTEDADQQEFVEGMRLEPKSSQVEAMLFTETRATS